MLFKLLVLCLSFFFIFSCNSETKATIDKINLQLSNGVHIVIEKTNLESSHIGIFSNHDFTHSYSYKLHLIDKGVNWDGGSGEPKGLIFCKDSIFLYSLKEKFFTNDALVRKDSTIKSESYYQVVEVYQKHEDQRYLFNMMGQDFWVDISENEYLLRKHDCEEFAIPNDGELTL